MIRPVIPNDAPALVAIDNPYVRDTLITFEEEPVSVVEIARPSNPFLAPRGRSTVAAIQAMLR